MNRKLVKSGTLEQRKVGILSMYIIQEDIETGEEVKQRVSTFNEETEATRRNYC